MGDFSTEMSPQHFDRIEPWAVSRQVEQDDPTCGCPYGGFCLIIFMHTGIVPGHIDRSRRILLDQGFKQLSNLLPPLPSVEQHHDFSRVAVGPSHPKELCR